MKKLFFVALLSSLAIGSAYAGKPDLNAIIGTAEGDTPAFITNGGIDWFGNASTYNLSTSSSFAVDYGSAGYITGRGYCSTRAGDESAWNWDNNSYELLSANMVDNLTDETGQTGARYCYCKLDKYVPSGGSAQSLTGPWVYVSDMDNNAPGNCTQSCYQDCMSNFAYTESDRLSYRAAVFNAYPVWEPGDPGIITTQPYVDNALAGKQPIITGTGTNKLMLYGSSAGNIVTRDIVSSLGTSTTANTIPEVGAVVVGMNSKQVSFNGPADVVAVGTGTAGTVGERPIYSSTNNLDSALVTAQTINATATNAANAKITCVDNSCLLMQINMSVPAGISTRPYMDPSIAGIGQCYRAIRGNIYNTEGTCSAATLTYIGGTTSKSGKWGVVFPYGDVMGVSVCSSIKGNNVGTIATSSQSSTLNNNFNAQTGGGSPAGRYLWCKIESPMTSKWVYVGEMGTVNGCGEIGAFNCAQAIALPAQRRNDNRVTFKRNIFNTIQ